MVGRVPITRQENGQPFRLKPLNIREENGKDLVAAANAQCSAGEEIVLHIRNEQRILWRERFHYYPALRFPLSVIIWSGDFTSPSPHSAMAWAISSNRFATRP